MSHAQWRAATSLIATVVLAAACMPLPPPTNLAEPSQAAAPAPNPADLDQLVAPVALYDDQLLADVLTAATYPGEVVQAHRWRQNPANAALRDAALTNALAGQDWDPSVKSLVPFPAILQTMDSHLDWTQRLGEAFLAQPAIVMAAVQRLRGRAQAAGTLQTSPQEVVAESGGYITVAPPPSRVIYVPTYNPWCAYGAWPYTEAGPAFYQPYTSDCAGDVQLGWGAGLYLPLDDWGWGSFDWGRGELLINGDRWGRFGGWHGGSGHGGYSDHGNTVWQHDAGHRGGVPYSVAGNASRFGGGAGAQGFHGYAGRNGEPANTPRTTAPAFESLNSGHGAWAESARGQESRSMSRGGGGGGGFRGGGGGGFGGGAHGGAGHR
jgi:hypothetical protein